MALTCNPSLLIADEPTTALDVTIQLQIMQLLKRLRDESGMAILLITHDIGLVTEMADRVVVMYAGECVEETTTQRLAGSACPSLHAGSCCARYPVYTIPRTAAFIPFLARYPRNIRICLDAALHPGAPMDGNAPESKKNVR